MKKIFECVFVLVLVSLQVAAMSRNDYLQHIRKGEQQAWEDYQAQLQQWQQAGSLPEKKPAPHIYLARRDALLYALSGEKKYVQRARDILLNAEKQHAYYSAWILERIAGAGVLSAAEQDRIGKGIAVSADQAVDYWVEWGTMNHCSNHVVNSLTAALQLFPDHPHAGQWRQKRDINLFANWGKWSIEDSHLYIPVWLKPMVQYAEMAGREDEFYAMPMTKYYFDYLVQLMTPDGQIVEFGDGKYGKGYTWEWSLSLLEKGAAVYGDGKMKWAAHRLYQRHAKEIGLTASPELVEAYLWADERVEPVQPTDGSRLVLEDYVGKKVVFRDGWDPNATYLFLNFMDDAPFGIDGKEFLINTINVEAEKNHHGHADENAINCLMKNGALLLHDSGYRETSSTGPDGQFRADVFHNKLVARKGLADPDWRLLPFLLDGGRYKFVDTKLMHFFPFTDIEISRTRLSDAQMHYRWDRLISYDKTRDWFILFDIVKTLKRDAYTFATLYYTQDIVAFDEKNQSWFDTRYRTINNRSFAPPGGADDPETHLLIVFPEAEKYRQGAEQLRRAYQRETCIYSVLSDSLPADTLLVFPSLLIPHRSDEPAEKIMQELESMQIFRDDNGYALCLGQGDQQVQYSAMLDLEAGYLQENVRPRYSFDSGRQDLGEVVTDARYAFTRRHPDRLHYAFFKASRLDYGGQNVFQAQGMLLGQDNGVYQRWGVPHWVAWEDSFSVR